MPGIIDTIRKILAPEQKPVAQQATTEKTIPKSVVNFLTIQALNHERINKIRYSNDIYNTDTRIQANIEKLARNIVKGGFSIEVEDGPKRAQKVIDEVLNATKLNDHLYEFVRRALIDGDCFLEKIINRERQIKNLKWHEACYMRVNVDDNFKIVSPAQQYYYTPLFFNTSPDDNSVFFPQWQILHAKWSNDFHGVYGVPLFNSAEKAYTRANDGEDDLYVQRRGRAGRRYLHVIEEGSEGDIELYKENNQEALENPFAASADFFTNKKGSIQVIDGNAALQEIKDIEHHLETVMVASPVPSSLIGYASNVSRDTLKEQTQQFDIDLDFFTDNWMRVQFIDPIIETALLLAGILPESVKYQVMWRYKVVLTPDELVKIADAIMRYRAAGASEKLIAKIMVRYTPNVTLAELMENIKPIEVATAPNDTENPDDSNKNPSADKSDPKRNAAQSDRTARVPSTKKSNGAGANLQKK